MTELADAVSLSGLPGRIPPSRRSHVHPRARTRHAAILITILLAASAIGALPVAAAEPPPTIDVALIQSAQSHDPATNKAQVAVTIGAPGATAPWTYTLAVRGTTVARARRRRRATTITSPTTARSRPMSVVAQVTDAAGSTGRRGRHARPVALPAATVLPPRPRPDPRGPDADGGVLRRSAARGRFAGARRGPGDLSDARRRRGQPGVRARDVPRREPLGHARLRGHHEELGQHPLLQLGDPIRRHPVRPGQRLHLCEVPDMARQRPRLRRPAASLRTARLPTVSSASARWLGTVEGSDAPPALPQQHHAHVMRTCRTMPCRR